MGVAGQERVGGRGVAVRVEWHPPCRAVVSQQWVSRAPRTTSLAPSGCLAPGGLGDCVSR